MAQRVAIVGPGRVGTAVALGLVRAGHRVVAAVDGGGGSAARLARRIAGMRVVEHAVEAAGLVDLVLVTTADDAVEGVVSTVAAADAWRPDHHVVHCSGVLGLAPLRRAALSGAGIAAIHPAQTVPAGTGPDGLVGAAWAVTAPVADRGWAHDLVVDLGGDPFDLAEDARVRYHAALAVAANAVGAAVAVARDLVLSARVPDPARVLGPLVEATTTNVLAAGAQALTGPIVRGDVGTVAAHVESLEADLPALAADYRALQSVVLARVRPQLDPETAAALDEVLRPG